ncbi:MAG: aldo/keto reductase [Myxococcales bacterium]|nr:MAG: aldo/keto reductase [Myxococcales bacterium]
MRRRTLGNTGIELPELVLGTWGLSGDGYGQVDEADQEQVITRALGLGIDAFDTADAYAKGKMEERLGRLLAEREGAVVITKIGTDRAATPPIKRFDAEYLREAALASKARLGRRIDVLLLHNPSTLALDKPHVAQTMKDLCEEGVARAWGVSIGDAAIGTRAMEQGAQVLELAYNAFHPQDLAGVVTLAKEKQVGLIGRSALAHGLLCGQWPSTKQFPQGDHRRDRWTLDDFKKRISQLSALRPSVRGDVTSLRAAALRFALSEPALSAVVIGPRSAVQLDQLLREAGKEPPYLEEDARTALKHRLVNVGILP